MAKDLEITRLCDAYGALLTAHRLDMIRSYYDDDLSLAEIGENSGITRQAALCSIRQAEKALRGYEAALKAVEKADRLKEELTQIRNELDENPDGAKAALDRLISEI
ncbi:MAG: DNA-binding protein [Clostridiales bacterium]|nr:DNA-binding protein [Clostridiales bacterium]